MIAAAVMNSQRHDRKSKVWQWHDFFKPRKPLKRKAKTMDELRADFYEFKRIKSGQVE